MIWETIVIFYHSKMKLCHIKRYMVFVKFHDNSSVQINLKHHLMVEKKKTVNAKVWHDL